jgi:Flp pilus assembly pilin Flp
MLTLAMRVYNLRKPIARRLTSEERGQTLIEYALLAFLIAIAAIAFLAVIGVDLQETFNAVENALGLTGDEGAPTTGDEDVTAPA